jgi:acyl carrier protein
MIIDRLQPIFRDILDEPDLLLTPSLSPEDCPRWDSVAHVRLVLAVEEEFGVQFSTEDVVGFGSVADFVSALRNRGFQEAGA